jgi:hypothetical protein
MARFVTAVLLLCLAAFAFGSQAQAPSATKPLRILFIGNSLTYVTDIPARVAKVAEATGRKAVVETVTGPGFSLEDHWKDGRALEAIRKGWDVVVLQQGTSAHADGKEQLIEYAKKFARPIREAGAKPALYMVWPLQDRPKEFPATIQAYRDAAKAVDGMLLPVGEAWMRALVKDSRLRLYSDPIHPSSFGSDLAVLVIYLSLFPAGPQEFDESFVAKIARTLEIPSDRRDAFFDAATLAIDSPLAIK